MHDKNPVRNQNGMDNVVKMSNFRRYSSKLKMDGPQVDELFEVCNAL